MSVSSVDGDTTELLTRYMKLYRPSVEAARQKLNTEIQETHTRSSLGMTTLANLPNPVVTPYTAASKRKFDDWAVYVGRHYSYSNM